MFLSHILYIDDDDGMRRLASRALGRKGYDVSLAANGAEGVDMAKATAFDLIAVDHYMPGQDGLATLEALRSLPACPPVVYVTGSEESRIAVAALKSGADDYVVKSVGEDFFDLLASSFGQVLERAQLRRAREEAEAELRASNARLEALLKEVNHRVANNLQMVMSFVALQSKNLSDPGAREALQKTQQRIATVAQVNRRLYTTNDVEFVAMDDYLSGLATDLSDTWSNGTGERRVSTSAEALKVATDKAVALGMIANEWVSNACKYAYPAGEAGEVRIMLNRLGASTVELAVEDDGAGMPSDGIARGTGLGTRLIEALARTHKATVRYAPVHTARDNPGTRASISIELRSHELKAPG
ncbi:response regulator [Sphingopyxis granuli]|nr:two-component system sensor histidine kinase/response regulator [Sphingopyxis granuli]AVA15930.1 two-component system sensor histidine kinase/response regulator [Sphingopyxis sp. MG]QUM74231.1 response regulator [Sphingopyxis granuli]